MGKLHTLRRAIERDPESWFDQLSTGRYPCGAVSYRGQWYPKGSWWDGSWWDKPYRAFVRHVLIELGYLKPKD